MHKFPAYDDKNIYKKYFDCKSLKANTLPTLYIEMFKKVKKQGILKDLHLVITYDIAKKTSYLTGSFY